MNVDKFFLGGRSLGERARRGGLAEVFAPHPVRPQEQERTEDHRGDDRAAPEPLDEGRGLLALSSRHRASGRSP